MAIEDFNRSLDEVYNRLRHGLSQKSRDYAWRVSQLKALKKLLTENEKALCQAMYTDLRKGEFEVVATELGVVLSEIEDALENLKGWMRTKSVSTPLYDLPGSCEIRHDPLGLTLIVGAWNYPINLLLAPLVGAIVGGNAALLKPSELADKTAKILTDLIPRYMDLDLIAIIQAGPEETSALLDRVFDLIFFTGSGHVGKIVMTKAAKNLTPVVLELGGKSPALVLSDANIEVTARRLVWGKFMNAGQTCVAPDYVMVEPKVKDALVQALKKNIELAYGADASKSPDFCRIINARNFDRLLKLIEPQKVLHGGQNDRDSLYIAPTLVEAQMDQPVMAEEIFGPILPILTVPDLSGMIQIVKSQPKPLALYAFTSNSSHEERILNETSSGGVALNDVVMHMPVSTLPFGGVGASGMGHYHGEFSFKAFTHAKGVLRQATWLDIPIRYAPYKVRNLKILRWLF